MNNFFELEPRHIIQVIALVILALSLLNILVITIDDIWRGPKNKKAVKDSTNKPMLSLTQTEQKSKE